MELSNELVWAWFIHLTCYSLNVAPTVYSSGFYTRLLYVCSTYNIEQSQIQLRDTFFGQLFLIFTNKFYKWTFLNNAQSLSEPLRLISSYFI